jgi:hypothetical protein
MIVCADDSLLRENGGPQMVYNFAKCCRTCGRIAMSCGYASRASQAESHGRVPDCWCDQGVLGIFDERKGRKFLKV